MWEKSNTSHFHCVKSVRIRSFSGPYFPAFGLNTERYGVSFSIQSECGKIRTSKTPHTDTFHAVFCKGVLTTMWLYRCRIPKILFAVPIGKKSIIKLSLSDLVKRAKLKLTEIHFWLLNVLSRYKIKFCRDDKNNWVW